MDKEELVKCDNCKGSGLCSMGPVHDMDTGIITHDDCHRCDGKGEYSPTLEHKEAKNIWDHVNDFKVVYNKMLKKEWRWMYNWDCKYVELRIDMRDGGCIIMNKNGKRISPEQLAYQYKSSEK